MRYDPTAPVGARPVHLNDNSGPVAPVAGLAQVGVRDGIALSQSTAPYVGRGSLCMGADDTCGARKAKGTDLCAGHLRSAGLLD